MVEICGCLHRDRLMALTLWIILLWIIYYCGLYTIVDQYIIVDYLLWIIYCGLLQARRRTVHQVYRRHKVRVTPGGKNCGIFGSLPVKTYVSACFRDVRSGEKL